MFRVDGKESRKSDQKIWKEFGDKVWNGDRRKDRVDRRFERLNEVVLESNRFGERYFSEIIPFTAER
jgi:hypothetical protein